MGVQQDRVARIFDAAVELATPAERAAYLDAACSQDPQLRAEVEELLKHDAAGSFLDLSARPDPQATADEPSVSEGPGTVIGPYKLLEQIGEGGFGVVFMAEQTQPVRRKVALKVLKPGMDTRQVVARFEAERQALAITDHPNIAKVFDGGATPSGRPYFVMELVKGVPITEFCDQNQLTPRERLELFISVCQAVQHAHQKGIIHRDLKPSNVLVSRHDTTPTVKVIDFGVAKALGQELTDKTLFTGVAQMVGTPLYMSPEQAGMSDLDIDTRSDIYSLGVLLYELLTGTTPFGKERLKEIGYDEIRRIIREEEPPKPSTRISTLGQAASTVSTQRKSDPKRLRQLFRGELDWIVMKALEKDRNRRYESASTFAADVQRYLRDEPVLACPPSAWYRCRKFARRHKAVLVVATAMAVAVMMAVGSLISALTVLADSNAQIKAALARETGAKDDLLRALYCQHIALAERELSARKVGRAEEWLDRCPEDLRGWEWHYLKRRRYGSPPPLHHPGAVWAVAFSPDDRHLAAGTVDGTVYIWELRTDGAWSGEHPPARQLRKLEGHQKRVRRLAYSPDGRYLVTADEEGSMIVWEATTGQKVHTLRGHPGAPGATGIRGVQSVAFSPDSQRLASGGGDHQVRLWDLTTGQEIRALTGHVAPVQGVVFSADGRCITSASWDGTVKVWDASTGEETRSFRAPIRFVLSMALSPDGRRLALGSNEGTVKVVDLATGAEALNLPGHTNAVHGLAFSPDGRRLVSAGAGDWTMKVWDATTGDEALTLYGHSGTFTSVAFSSDGHRLASGGLDQTVRLWDGTPLSDAETSRQFLTLRGHTHQVYRVAFSPDGRRLASASQDETVRLWDAATGKETAVFREHDALVVDVAFSPDGQWLASASWDGTVKVRDVGSRQLLHTLRANAGFARCVAFSLDGRYLASGHHDGTVVVWDPNIGKEIIRFKEPFGPLTTVAFSPDSGRLAACGGDWHAKIWDTTNWQELDTLKHKGPVTGVAFRPDGRLLATSSYDGTVKLWDTTTWEAKLTLHTQEGDSKQLRDVAFSPDGKHLACGSWDQSVKVWDLTGSGAEPRSLLGHAGSVLTVAWAPDGKHFACGSGYPGKGEIKLWDTSRWELFTARSAP
jgi:WD40 repeat protein